MNAKPCKTETGRTRIEAWYRPYYRVLTKITLSGRLSLSIDLGTNRILISWSQPRSHFWLHALKNVYAWEIQDVTAKEYSIKNSMGRQVDVTLNNVKDKHVACACMIIFKLYALHVFQLHNLGNWCKLLIFLSCFYWYHFLNCSRWLFNDLFIYCKFTKCDTHN